MESKLYQKVVRHYVDTTPISLEHFNELINDAQNELGNDHDFVKELQSDIKDYKTKLNF
jgi:hypothetical protein